MMCNITSIYLTIMQSLKQMRTCQANKKCQFHLSNVAVTLTFDQGHQNWYEGVCKAQWN